MGAPYWGKASLLTPPLHNDWLIRGSYQLCQHLWGFTVVALLDLVLGPLRAWEWFWGLKSGEG